MSDYDFQYLLMRLILKPTQPSAQALRRVYLRGDPYGAAARMFSVPVHKMETLWRQAEAIRAGFTMDAGDVDAAGVGHVNPSDANELLAYQRRREVEAATASAQRSALKAAGLTDEQITAALAVKGE